MMQIFFLLMIMSMPNQPSVKYHASIYSTEQECYQALDGYMNAYNSKPQDYKDKLVTEAFCIPFESFPIKGLQKDIGA
jgi:hypothetical protein